MKQYDADSRNPSLCSYAVDMQKVVLLPRMPNLKASFFVSRLVVFNETFAKMYKTAKPINENHICILWHEAITGRNACDVASAFIKFFKQLRDEEKIVLWMDNCTAQNKNWCLFSTMLTMVNSDVISTNEIIFKYLVLGHTFMAADGLHGRIEQRMRKIVNILDFDDFVATCKEAAPNVTPVTMTKGDCYPVVSMFRARRSLGNEVLPKLKSIVEVKFQRYSHTFRYKTDFDAENYTEVLLKDGMKKNVQFILPEPNVSDRGIMITKKAKILEALVPSMTPSTRKSFWLHLPTNDSSVYLLHNVESA